MANNKFFKSLLLALTIGISNISGRSYSNTAVCRIQSGNLLGPTSLCGVDP